MKYVKSGIVLILCLSLLGCNKDKSTVPGQNSNKQIVSGKKKTALNGKQYNVLLITVDTLRWDRLSVYSKKYLETPQIDSFAKESYVFTRAFAHNPVTLPSHTNILTGTTPLYHGISDNSGFRLEDRFLTLAEYLKDADYDTGAFIAAFPLDSRFGLNQGFDNYDDNYGTHNTLELFFVERRAKEVIAPAVEWISTRENKWFSWIHLFDPHQPYAPPAPFDKEYEQDLYSGEVAYVDQQLGVLFSYLKKKKILENTLVIITGDHGEALGEKGEKTHSYFAYNNTILIPLIIHLPGAGNGRVSENASHVDLFPTVCAALGLNIPSHLHGESLLPLIEGKERINKQIYFESLTPFLNRGWAPLRGFVENDIKYIDLPIKEIYDLNKDITEKNNLAQIASNRKLSKELDSLILKLSGAGKVKRSNKIDPEVQKRLKSLGYLSSTQSSKKKLYTPRDDLKTLLPLQNKMLGALAALQSGSMDVAVSELQAIIKESPGFILVYSHLANIYKDAGQIEEAVSILKEGLKSNSENLSLLSKLGILLAEANRHIDAIDVLTNCIEKEDFNPENYNYLGVAYYKSGNYQAAEKNYRKALELDNNYASVFNNLGTLYLTRFLREKNEQHYGIAMQNFAMAIKIDPKLFAAYNGRGAAYHFKKDYQSAIREWKRAIEIKPDYIDPYFSIGITYIRLGDKSSALEILKLLKERQYSLLPLNDQQRLDRLIAEARY